MTQELTDFLAELQRQDAAPKTVRTYRSDLEGFARWFSTTTGEPFSAHAVPPTALREHRPYLRTVQRRTAASVNRRLAALRKFFLWAKAVGHISDLPTDGVRGVPTGPHLPSPWPNVR